MKKAVLFFATLLTAGAMMAQTIVSTEVEKRNVLIEEFTGVGCGYCPDGHARANAICAQYEGHAWAINIHAGGYATGSGYETTDGNAIHNEYQSEIEGYPCGVVNRGSVQDRGQWAATAATVRGQDSPVNIAATATIDPMTRELNVNVEVYYTGSQSVTTNYLNVALVQNNIIGPQSNYGSQVQGYPYNQDYVLPDGSYRHMHMLRDMITDPWGDAITSLTAGTFYEMSYTYSLPASIGAVPIGDFADLEIIVFMNENHRKVITACKADVTVLPGAFVTGFEVQNSDCSLEYQPSVSVANTFDVNVDSWTFLFNGETVTFDQTVVPGGTTTFVLPAYTINLTGDAVQNCSTDLSVEFTSFVMEGETITVSGTPITKNIGNFNVYTLAGPVHVRLGIDHYGSEAKLALIDFNSCSELWHEGPWTDLQPANIQYLSQLKPARYFNIDFSPAQAGLYILRATDSYGDGWAYTTEDAHAGIWLTDDSNNVVNTLFESYIDNSGHGHGESFEELNFYLNITNSGDGSHNRVSYEGIDDVANVKVEIYPNPTTDRLNIECGQTISRIEVLDVAGRTVMSQNGNVNSINTKALAEGVYMLRVMTEAGVSAQKFVKE